MTDVRRDVLETSEEDRLPWLEAVEDDDARRGVSPAKMVVGVLAALLALGLVIGGVFWMRERNAGPAGEPGLIAAPAGDYKTRPDAPGGMEVAGQGDAAYATSEGADPNAAIDLSALPEAPVRGADRVTTADAAAAAPKPTPAPKPARTATAAVEPSRAPLAASVPKPAAKPAPTPAAAPATSPAAGGSIQLGAFSSEAKAQAAWKSLAGRFSFLAPLTPSYQPVTTDSGTLYRLRAGAGSQASNLCGRLRVAGESCVVLN